MKKKPRIILSVLLIIVLTLLAASCSANDEAPDSQREESVHYDRADESPDVQDGAYSSEAGDVHNTAGSISGDKIIYRQNLMMETDNLNRTVDKMEQDLDRYAGHIHRYQVISEQDELPRGDFTLRVPSESLKAFVDSMKNYGVFTQEVLESDDVSDTYYDLEANLRNQKIQERRLLELLEEAENLSDVLTLESELSRIRREIEGLQGTLNRLDDQVQYSTVYLSIREVETDALEGRDFTDQLGKNFRDSLEKFQGAVEYFLLWIAAYFPFVILAGIVLGLIGKFYPSVVKRFNRKSSSE